MELFELTRALVDIESITENEKAVGEYLFQHLSSLASTTGGKVEKMEVEADRFNLFACWGEPMVTLSTHIDTVPPFFASREDDEFIWGRGSCDTKGIIAAMIFAVRQLLEEGHRNIALLFVVGEERNSTGAACAAKNGRGSKFLINGEPTENKLALGSKGALRLELSTHGRMAHSAYPELGDSAILKLLDILADLRNLPLPKDSVLGQSTLNIGTIAGGRAPNVIPDEARAELFFRLIDDGGSVEAMTQQAVNGRGDLKKMLLLPAVHLGSVPGFDTSIVAFTTDIPGFKGTWGKPFLFGPGSIHVAHTSEERIPKKQLVEAVPLYKQLVKYLLV
jgi:acetylornithine deacetylase